MPRESTARPWGLLNWPGVLLALPLTGTILTKSGGCSFCWNIRTYTRAPRPALIRKITSHMKSLTRYLLERSGEAVAVRTCGTRRQTAAGSGGEEKAKNVSERGKGAA